MKIFNVASWNAGGIARNPLAIAPFCASAGRSSFFFPEFVPNRTFHLNNADAVHKMGASPWRSPVLRLRSR